MGFRAGDEVRLLHSTDAGRIVRIIDEKTAEVEIEDGFIIPVLLRELVPVAEEEKTEFDSKATPDPEKEPLLAGAYREPLIDRILFALEVTETGDLRIFLVNDSDFTLLGAISGMHNGMHDELYKGMIKNRSCPMLGVKTRKELGKYQKITFQFILSAPRCKKPPPPLLMEKRWDLHELLKKKSATPLLGRRTSQIRIDPEPLNIDPELLKEHMTGDKAGSIPETKEQNAGPEEMVVDLHIEKLTDDPATLTPAEILDLQIKAFEKALDRGIISGVKKIKFIHGLGNGTLRNTIHKKLRNSPLIRYFEGVEKSRFGYGATMIYLK